MFRNFLFVCSAVFALTLLVYGWSEREPRADLTYVNAADIHTLDPARMSWTQDFRLGLNIWEGLTTWHERTLEPIGGSAEFLPVVSEDGLTYTFTIRDDARWSNGDPVTAADFVRGWRRGMEPGTAADYTFLFTDTLAGAREYVRWRGEGVAALTALSRLRSGSGVTGRQASELMRMTSVSAAVLASGLSVPKPRGENEAAWEAFTQSLSTSNIDWDLLHGQLHAEHGAELDSRFDQVGVRALDPRTLVVRLKQPCPFFLDLTAFPTFLPCHQSIEGLRERFQDRPINEQGLVVYDPQWTKPDYRSRAYPGLITNGAFQLADRRFKRRLRLTVNPYYRDAERIECRVIDMLVYDSMDSAIMAYEAGDVDFLTAMDVPYDHELSRLARTGERPDFHLCTALATCFFNFNCVSATVGEHANPFLNSNVRKAFALAVDKEQLVEKVLARGDVLAHSFVPQNAIAGYDPPLGIKGDVEEARRLLAEAGFPDGVGLPPIDLLYTASDERMCQALARMWETRLGVRMHPRSKESKTFADDKAGHRYMISRANWYGDFNDPTTFLDCLNTGNGNNDSGYSNPRYDALLQEARLERDSATRFQLLRQAEAILVEQDFPILPVFHYTSLIAIKPHVQGLYANSRFWFPFRQVTLSR